MEKFNEKIFTTVTLYKAVDGTIFETKEECESYEKSAAGVMWDRLKDAIVPIEVDIHSLLNIDEETDIIAIYPRTSEQAEAIMQLLYIGHSYLLKNENLERRERIVNAINDAKENQDIVFLKRAYHEGWYYIDTRLNIINELKKIGSGTSGS